MKNVLVLGGNGFIGRNLCKTLSANKEYKVFSFDLNVPEHKMDNVNYLDGDFFDDYVLETILKDKDIIYHAICTMNPGNSNDKYIVGYERDLIQTIKLCDMLKNSGSRLIFLSSGGTIYGKQTQMPINEDVTPAPINHYGNLKLCIESTLRVFKTQQNLDFIIARVANPYGPGQDYKKGVGFIDAVIKHAMNNETVEIWGDGSVVRDYIYIDDVCKALAELSRYKGDMDIVNIASGTGTNQNEIVEIVKQLHPSLKVKYLDKRSVDADMIILDNNRMKAFYKDELVSLEQGIKNYYEYVGEINGKN